jgi:hypothetical protein
MHDLRFPVHSILCLTISAALLALTGDARADGEPDPIATDRVAIAKPPILPRLAISAASGFLASPGANGAAMALGARVGVGQHVVVALDLGYGVLGAATGPTVQDRWWIIPSVALAIPIGPVRLELGGGFGLGASSGYVSWSAYVAKPFTPIWAYQLMPTLDAHAAAAIDLGPKLGLFARLDAAKLLASGSDRAPMDTTWGMLSSGATARVL